ncbi:MULTISPECIES: exo-beta-N-acetylmuramidase NamZ domain-containing protein [unclassified Flavobacterium]|uniref:exo-beta-N-acetylmuramidase NamZ family protein n=1 Tax=unclassified Flavobacterium TaxID=196869 RepID=UPI001F139354|nr:MULTISPECIES: DUF1343 domain-containing protein [unclassified Flavobacterium]UMY66927.1 DUF1343 domain-containing protein [Flavobacterium sp. HJ-32-4]
MTRIRSYFTDRKPLAARQLMWALVSCVCMASCVTRKSTVHTKTVKPTETTAAVETDTVSHIIRNTAPDTGKILTGADNFDGFSALLKNKRVGIVTNQSGLRSDSEHIVDYLASRTQLVKIFAPEHGFRGTADAGETIVDGKDVRTGLPIVSIYGDNKKPKPAQLHDVDVMVFDLQDVGVRFFTYISTLHYVMEACAENHIPLIVLDRPNPNGHIVDGPMLEPENRSFVGMHTIPVLHGMTIGEYARMINGEKWLKDGIQCELEIVTCASYTHDKPYSILIKPSPNLPNDKAINLYASICLFEGTNVSVGRGTERQFQVYGSPYLPYSGYCFIPSPNVGAKDPLYNGRECNGEDLLNYPRLDRLELKWLIRAYNETEDKSKFFNSYFTKLAGTTKLREQVEAGMTAAEIRASWEGGLIEFRKVREKYLIYP